MRDYMTLEGTQKRKERCQPVLLVYTWQSVVDSWAGSRDSPCAGAEKAQCVAFRETTNHHF